jgi:hypothetical protein
MKHLFRALGALAVLLALAATQAPKTAAAACIEAGGYPFVANGCLPATALNAAVTHSRGPLPPGNSAGGGALQGYVWIDTSVAPPETWRICQVAQCTGGVYHSSEWGLIGTFATGLLTSAAIPAAATSAPGGVIAAGPTSGYSVSGVASGSGELLFTPTRVRLTGNQVIYVNWNGSATETCGVNGTLTCQPGNDAAADGTIAHPFQHNQNAYGYLMALLDLSQQSVTIDMAHGISTNYAFNCQGGFLVGSYTFGLVGDFSNPMAVGIQAPDDAIALFIKDGCVPSSSSYEFVDSPSANAVAAVDVDQDAMGDFRSVTWAGNWNNNSVLAEATTNGILNMVGPDTANGVSQTNTIAPTGPANINIAFLTEELGQIKFNGEPVAVPNAITINSAGGWLALLGGNMSGLGFGTTFTGAGVSTTTGPRCLIDGGQIQDGVSPNSMPGSTLCAPYLYGFNAIDLVGLIPSAPGVNNYGYVQHYAPQDSYFSPYALGDPHSPGQAGQVLTETGGAGNQTEFKSPSSPVGGNSGGVAFTPGATQYVGSATIDGTGAAWVPVPFVAASPAFGAAIGTYADFGCFTSAALTSGHTLTCTLQINGAVPGGTPATQQCTINGSSASPANQYCQDTTDVTTAHEFDQLNAKVVSDAGATGHTVSWAALVSTP